MASFRWFGPPAVVPAIGVLHGSGNQFSGIDVVQRGDLNGDIMPADLLDIAASERAHSAMPAELVMRAFRSKLVVGQCIVACQQPEGIWLDDHAPVARLC